MEIEQLHVDIEREPWRDDGDNLDQPIEKRNLLWWMAQTIESPKQQDPGEQRNNLFFEQHLFWVFQRVFRLKISEPTYAKTRTQKLQSIPEQVPKSYHIFWLYIWMIWPRKKNRHRPKSIFFNYIVEFI